MSEEKIPITRGSGNVYADLDLPDADLLLAKARLVAALEAARSSWSLGSSSSVFNALTVLQAVSVFQKKRDSA